MERPILFSTTMVQAILAGRKTQTRRVIKTPRNKLAAGFRINSDIDKTTFWPEAIDEEERGLEGNGCNMTCPYGEPGDILWVKETVAKGTTKLDDPSVSYYLFKDGSQLFTSGEYFQRNCESFRGIKWTPSIHMPKEACRIRLRITSIRVERLDDISETDAVSEGIEFEGKQPWYKDYIRQLKQFPFANPYYSFKSLWTSINGEDSWNTNPWVWVIEFKVMEPAL